jgi:diamine N-acetyltransferase
MIQISPCTAADIDVLCEISKTTFIEAFEHLNDPDDFKQYISTAFTRERIACELDTPQSHFFFAREGKQVLGYLKINFAPAQSDVNDENSLEIERIYVRKNAQGKQVGQQLFQLALQIATEKHKKYLWLGVWEKNEKAIRFYEKNGFKTFDKHIFVIGNDPQTDFLMKLMI